MESRPPALHATTIDFETHFVTREWVEATYANPGYPRFVDDKVTGRRRMYYREDAFEPHGDFLLNRLVDLGDGRIEEMDKAGIDKAIVSLTAPGVDHFDPAVGTSMARNVNDELAAAIDRYPDRLMGFAALAPKDPQAAAAELERCVKELGFKGWKTHSNFCYSYIDERNYWP